MTPDSLLSLLRSHQDGVYTVCLHVLRNSHDAEDAAQEAMLKIASGAKDVRDPRAFKSWLYRLVFRTAVDHARRRATRRRIEEGSAPMSPGPLTDEQRDAIHEAMAALPDDDRLMLAEHYFEKIPIVELGRREGISDVAMGKRIEKAREKLKRGLAGAGILVGASQVSHALESVTAAAAPSGLITSAIVSKAALAAAGGMAMATKSLIPIMTLFAVLFLTVGGAGGYLIAERRSGESARIRELETQLAGLKAAPGRIDQSTLAAPKIPVPAETKATPSPESPAKNRLAATLEKYKAVKDRHRAKRKAWNDANPEKGIDPKELSKDQWALFRELEGIREEIFEDPETFLNFLRQPENEIYVWNLFDVTLVRMQGEGFTRQQVFNELPRPLMDGLLDLLKTGNGAVRDQVLRFMCHVRDQPDEFKRSYLDLLTDPHSNIVAAAAEALTATSPLTPEEFSRLTTAFDQSPDRHVRQGIVSAMWRIQTPESRDWRLSALENGRMPELDATLASSLMTAVRDGLGDAFEDRFVRAVSASLSRTTDEGTYLQLLQTTRMLPNSKSKTHFELAAVSGPTPKVREAATRCLELIKAGQADWKSIGTILNEAQTKN